ncbi:MAG: ABC transporter permease [Oscillospiraceae bacterium]|nr:ABC transporter permease [Oscillospiraceae bacterium]
MRKIAAVYRNELYKICHRAVTWLLLGVMVLAVLGAGGLVGLAMKAMTSRSSGVYYDENGNAVDPVEQRRKELQEQINGQKKFIESGMKRLTEEYETFITPEETGDGVGAFALGGAGGLGGLFVGGPATEGVSQLYYDLTYNRAQLRTMELCLAHGIDYFGWYAFSTDYDFRTEVTQIYPTLQQMILVLEDKQDFGPGLDEGEAAQLAMQEALAKKVEGIMRSQNYEEWLDLEIAFARLTLEPEYMEGTERFYELLRKGNPDGSLNPALVQQVVTDIGNLEQSLKDDVDHVSGGGASVPLTDDQRAEFRDRLAVKTYRLEHQAYSAANILSEMMGISVDPYNICRQAGMAVLVILILLLAGGAVAQETSTGSIKSLIIAPVRRWKILTGKIAAVSTVAVVGTLLLLGALLAVNALFFRDSLTLPYVYALDGQARELHFLVFRALEALVSLAPLMVYLLFALMLSAVIRHTAPVVGLSIGAYFITYLAGEMLTMVPSSGVVRFLPFAHLSLEHMVFPFVESNVVTAIFSAGGSVTEKGSVLFSSVYLAVMALCFGWTAYDSFCRRDIK